MRTATWCLALLSLGLLGDTAVAQPPTKNLPRQTTIDAAGGPIVVSPFMHASVQIEHGGRVIMAAIPRAQMVARFDAEHAAIVKLHAASANQPLGAAPIIVLTPANVPDPNWNVMQEQIAQLSSNASRRSVASQGGDLHLSAPAVVVRAVGDVVTAVRQRGTVPLQ